MVEITGNVSLDDPNWESTAGNGQISLIAELEDELKDSREQLDRASALLARTQISQDENVRLLLDAELSDTSLLSALVRVLKLPTARSDVIELIRVLRAREADKKMLEDSVAMLEERLRQSAIKQDETNARMERLENDLATARCDLVERDRLLLVKADVERRLEDHVSQAQSEIERLLATGREEAAALENLTSSKAAAEKHLEDALARTSEKEDMVEKLTVELARRTADLETVQKAIGTRPVCSMDDSSVITMLKSEVSGLREELNRAKLRVVSLVCTSDEGARSRTPSDEDPAEEKIRLLLDGKALDEDVLEGLVKGLKIPAASTTSLPNIKEILFPANLISLVTNEMWKYGLIQESERFLAAIMQTIQAHVMSFTGEDAIVPGIFWLSNVHEMLSFICVAERDVLQGIGPGEETAGRPFNWEDYEHLVSVVKHDLDSLEYNIYHAWMMETKKRLAKMVVPALIESQALPGFTVPEGGGRLLDRLLSSNTGPASIMDDILKVLNQIWGSLKSYHMEESVVQQVMTELLKLIGVTSFNDLLMRRNFSSWKRAMQIQYNITRIEEWCKSHDMPEGTLQLEHLMQATKLLQLKKATTADVEIIYDVCWMLSPMQIHRMCANYHVADYETPISPEILRVVASRVNANDRTDLLLLSPESEEVGAYELPLPREISEPRTYVPAYLNVSHLRRLAALVA